MKKGGATQISANYVYNNINLLTNVTNNGIITVKGQIKMQKNGRIKM